MNGVPMSRAQKAAAVLLAVGAERAATVLSHLSDDEVEQVTMEIATLGEVSSPDLDVVLHEFRDEAMAQQELLTGSEAEARALMRQLRGSQADGIVDRLLAAVHSEPFHFLRIHEPSEVLQHLRDEHPQTIAVVLSHVPSRVSAQLLAGLPTGLQADVAHRLATLERTDPDVVAHVETALRDRLGEVKRRSGRRDGVKELADMLHQTDRGTERSVLQALEEMDPEIAERVRSMLFLFEDIVTLDARSLQEVLRNVDLQRLAVAVKGTSAQVRAEIEANLSQRARTAMIEEIDLLGPVRLSEVEEAQSEVVQIVQQMEQDGRIEITREEEELVG